MNDFQMSSACSPYGLLACKIVQQAIVDYRAPLRRGGAKSSMEEIRRFLKSQWCDDLLSFTEVDGGWVLHMLEREAETKRETGREPRMVTIDGQTKGLHTWCRELGIASSTWMYEKYRECGREFVEERLTAIKRRRAL